MGWIDTIFNLFGALLKGGISSTANGFQESIKGWQDGIANILKILSENGGVDPNMAKVAAVVQNGLASASGAIPTLTKSAKEIADEAAAAAKAAANSQVALAPPAPPAAPAGQKPPASTERSPA